MTTPFTEAELLASMGLPPKPAPNPNPKPTKETDSNPAPSLDALKGNFLTTQFQLLSTPYFVIYLQGKKGSGLATVDLDSEDDALRLAFSSAIFRKVGRNVPTEVTNLLPAIEANFYQFYTDKEWHKTTISAILAAGGTVTKELAINRAMPLAAIESYLTALSGYLVSKGFDSVDAWLAKDNAIRTKITAGLSIDEVTSFFENL